ncbi:MAG: cation transporter [archaeon]
MTEKKIIIPVKGMHCVSCSMLLEQALKNVSGVRKASVSHSNNNAIIIFDSTKTSEKNLQQEIIDVGYKVN